MSKYGFGWIYKSYLSPVGLLLRLFGYTPPEDAKPEVAENEYRFTIMPVPGYGMKELTEVGKRLFGKYGETKESIADTLLSWQQAVADREYFDIMDHFTVEVTAEQREQFIKDLGKSKCWIIYEDEYMDLQESADSILKRELRVRKRDEIVLELAKKMERNPVTKESIATLIKDRVDAGEEHYQAIYTVGREVSKNG